MIQRVSHEVPGEDLNNARGRNRASAAITENIFALQLVAAMSDGNLPLEASGKGIGAHAAAVPGKLLAKLAQAYEIKQ